MNKHRPMRVSKRIGYLLQSRACREQATPEVQACDLTKESHRLQPEALAFVEEVRRKWIESGENQSGFAERLGILNGKIHLNYLLRGRRGISFVKAIRIANMLGIDLGELQRRFK